MRQERAATGAKRVISGISSSSSARAERKGCLIPLPGPRFSRLMQILIATQCPDPKPTNFHARVAALCRNGQQLHNLRQCQSPLACNLLAVVFHGAPLVVASSAYTKTAFCSLGYFEQKLDHWTCLTIPEWCRTCGSISGPDQN